MLKTRGHVKMLAAVLILFLLPGALTKITFQVLTEDEIDDLLGEDDKNDDRKDESTLFGSEETVSMTVKQDTPKLKAAAVDRDEEASCWMEPDGEGFIIHSPDPVPRYFACGILLLNDEPRDLSFELLELDLGNRKKREHLQIRSHRAMKSGRRRYKGKLEDYSMSARTFYTPSGAAFVSFRHDSKKADVKFALKVVNGPPSKHDCELSVFLNPGEQHSISAPLLENHVRETCEYRLQTVPGNGFQIYFPFMKLRKNHVLIISNSPYLFTEDVTVLKKTSGRNKTFTSTGNELYMVAILKGRYRKTPFTATVTAV